LKVVFVASVKTTGLQDANAVLLLDRGKSGAEIADFLYLDDDTIRGWYKAFLKDGRLKIQLLKDFVFGFDCFHF